MISKSDMTALEDLLADESWNARQEFSTNYFVPPTGTGDGAIGDAGPGFNPTCRRARARGGCCF